MSRTITYSKLVSCLNQRVPIFDFMNPPNDISGILDDEIQYRLLPQLIALIAINPYYIKFFLKKYIHTLESSNNEVVEDIYELYCSEAILNAVEMSPNEADTILYPIGGFKNEIVPNNGLVVIKETPKVISGNGTTGLRTWEAALYLANYLNSNPIEFKNKSICELGTGTGLVGIALAKYYHNEIYPIREIIFTDGDASLIENLSKTFQLNGLVIDSRIKTQQLLWGTTNPNNSDFIQAPPSADYVVAADVTYDSSILPQLSSTINDFFNNGTKMAIIAATVRNEETLEDWEEELQKWFAGNFRVIEKCDQPALIESNCWFKYTTPEIRIYEITPH
ncbi:uncharacterized protein AC631_00337 [Debaryomyces fabryi]|uniref:Protein-lysine N-methyltransferase EFM3 n=1 Tax=Debaryomyces fabryi TaxID=58627 RepID=A0A0V1Q697_9ASCO|nr:uncharacterized protein AC631_00337 [Debaryomyces fabryi]KSA03882.1 hypothetical protein AC631_00337 [Debaryomyces fabryi]CUM48740.1 unnamed protein product [Debaryomyces fabryi]